MNDTPQPSAAHEDPAAATAAVVPSLHDCLSLGNVEEGLSIDGELEEQRHRLPILLRLLAAARPHASIPTFAGWNDQTTFHDNNHSTPNPNNNDNNNNSQSPDVLVDQVVSKLEDMAATHSGAEAMDVVTLSIVPTVTRKISRVPPLRRKQVARSGDGVVVTMWDTQELSVFHSTNPNSSAPFSHHHHHPLKRQNSELVLASSGHLRQQLSEDEDDDQFNDEDDDDDDNIHRQMALDEDDPMDEDVHRKSQKRKSNSIRRRSNVLDSMDRKRLHSEDSPEAMVTSTMSELVTLVLNSLQPKEGGGGNNNNDDDDDGDAVEGGAGAATTSTSSRLLHDLVLSSQSSDGGSAMASILHHAPVLRHQHVANALCRTGVSRVATLIARLAANCPTAVPCLLRGCMDAYHIQAKVSKAAILALANLSPRETSRVLATLQEADIMWEVQLELAMNANMPVVVANLLIQHLSSSSSSMVSASLIRNVSQDSPEADNDMLTDFSEKNTSNDNNNRSFSASNLKRTNLTQILQADPGLQQRTLLFLYQQLTVTSMPSSSCCWGQICLYLAAYGWFQFCVASAPTSSESNASPIACVPSFGDLIALLQRLIKATREAKRTNSFDRSYRLVLAVCIVTLGRYLTAAMPKEYGDAAQRLLTDMLLSKEPSSCQVFLARLAWLMQHSFVKELCDVVVDTMASSPISDGSSSPSRSPSTKMMDGLFAVCDLAIKGNIEMLETACLRGVAMERLQEDLSALVLILRKSPTPATFITQITKDFLQSLLNNPDQCQTMIRREGVGDVVFEGAVVLAKSGLLAVPLVLPLQIEWLGGHVDLQKLVHATNVPLGPVECQFLLQVLYCFSVLELHPSSPFSFDPRALPLKEVLDFCDGPAATAVATCVVHRLKEQVCNRAPEVGARMDRRNVPSTRLARQQGKHFNRHDVIRTLSTTIRDCCLSENLLDPDGTQAEQLFVFAERYLADTELHETVVSSLLAVRHAPLPRTTYAQLCRDPLVILKLPLRIWKCGGLKRIALFVLSNTLEANAEITKEACKTNEVILELLAARNSLLARCLLSTVSSAMAKDNDPSMLYSPFCVTFTCFLRRLIAETSGLVSMLVKESLPDEVQDWLIEFVPESMSDWQSLATLLTDRCSLTAAERLLAADSVLRVAIAHGHACEEEAQSLAFAALTLLVSSFFLVVGPVGVPVNALLRDDNSLDVMQASRKATLRMLRSLPHVRGRRTHLRDECGMALQKLAGLCKGETIMGGFPGAVVGGRKAVLKDVYDAITKAANAVGSTIQI